MNTAIEHDDGNPELRRRSREVMEQWRQFVVQTIRRGIRKREMRPDTDPEQVGTVFVAMIEGAVMMYKLYGDISCGSRLGPSEGLSRGVAMRTATRSPCPVASRSFRNAATESASLPCSINLGAFQALNFRFDLQHIDLGRWAHSAS